MCSFRSKGVLLLTTLILLVPASSTRLCSKFNRHLSEVECEDLNLQKFPDFAGFSATTYKLNGNSFSLLNGTTFPPRLATEIQILRNDIPLRVDRSAFYSLSSSLAVLKVQNVDFEFDRPFAPVAGVESLNNLELGNKRYSRNLTVPFLDDRTMDRLVWLKVTHSGVENVQPEALHGGFRRLRHLGFSHNKLKFMPEGIKRVLSLSERRSLELDLSYNLLDTVVQGWFPSGCILTSLDLSYNNIRSVRLRSLDNCPLLNRLVLEGNIGLLYISPSVFPSNCHLKPRLDIHVQHTGIRNVEFSLRSCVGRVLFWNTSVPCTCRHESLLQCPSAKELFGECLWNDGLRLLNKDATRHLSKEGCHLTEGDELYNPQPLPDAGDPLASLKDWGDCPVVEAHERRVRSAPDSQVLDTTNNTRKEVSPSSASSTDAVTTSPTATGFRYAADAATGDSSISDSKRGDPSPNDTAISAPSTTDATQDVPTIADATTDAPSAHDAKKDASTTADDTINGPITADATTDASTTIDSITDAPFTADLTIDTPSINGATTDVSAAGLETGAPIAADATTDAPATADVVTEAPTTTDATTDAPTAADATAGVPNVADATTGALTSTDTTAGDLNAADSTASAPIDADAATGSPTVADAATVAPTVADATVDAPTVADAAIYAATVADTTVDAPTAPDSTKGASTVADAIADAPTAADTTARIVADATTSVPTAVDVTSEVPITADAPTVADAIKNGAPIVEDAATSDSTTTDASTESSTGADVVIGATTATSATKGADTATGAITLTPTPETPSIESALTSRGTAKDDDTTHSDPTTSHPKEKSQYGDPQVMTAPAFPTVKPIHFTVPNTIINREPGVILEPADKTESPTRGGTSEGMSAQEDQELKETIPVGWDQGTDSDPKPTEQQLDDAPKIAEKNLKASNSRKKNSSSGTFVSSMWWTVTLVARLLPRLLHAGN